MPIIAIRKVSNAKLRDGIFTTDGTPTCMVMVPMDYVRSDPQRGHLYRCRPEGCRLKYRKGVRYCHDEEWMSAQQNPRVLGPVARSSRKWKLLYSLRQSIESMFKSLKQPRRLEGHCLRGLKNIALHAAMSVLAFQATVLVRLRMGQMKRLRWMVQEVP